MVDKKHFFRVQCIQFMLIFISLLLEQAWKLFVLLLLLFITMSDQRLNISLFTITFSITQWNLPIYCIIHGFATKFAWDRIKQDNKRNHRRKTRCDFPILSNVCSECMFVNFISKDVYLTENHKLIFLNSTLCWVWETKIK